MFVLKKRKYNWLDMWRMPFESAPFSTVTVTVQKLITALASIFQMDAGHIVDMGTHEERCSGRASTARCIRHRPSGIGSKREIENGLYCM